MGRPKKDEETKAGKLSADDIRAIINKKEGNKIAFNLAEEDVTKIRDWISTGSFLLDLSIVNGQEAGIPAGRFTELAGLEGTGKSYMSAQIMANAQKKGYNVIFFESEFGSSAQFLEKAGINLQELTYVPTITCENVLEHIESLLGAVSKEEAAKLFFVWDSLANTPTKAESELEKIDPTAAVSEKARIMSLGLKKLIMPVATSGGVLILNQLKTVIDSSINMKYATDEQKFFTPGGKSLLYAYSLRVWLTKPKSKDSFIYNDKGNKIGSTVKAKMVKDRFGNEGKVCEFKILWGEDPPSIQDEDSWLQIVEKSPHYTGGVWRTLKYENGEIEKFQSGDWKQKLQNQKFRDRVVFIIREEMLIKGNSLKEEAEDDKGGED